MWIFNCLRVPQEQTHPGSSPMSKNGDMSLASQPDSSSRIPFMDHWNVSRPHVSLRDIIKEEQVLQANMQKVSEHHKGVCNMWPYGCSFSFPLTLSGRLSFRPDRVALTSIAGMELRCWRRSNFTNFSPQSTSIFCRTSSEITSMKRICSLL